MIYQLWLRTLLNDAVVRNKAHIVALLGPHDLRRLYIEGTPPSIESIFRDYEGKATSIVDNVIDERKNRPDNRIVTNGDGNEEKQDHFTSYRPGNLSW